MTGAHLRCLVPLLLPLTLGCYTYVPAGLAAVERAKADGSWSVLDSVERLEVPADLAEALAARPPATANFAAFTPSARRQLLGWVAMARRPATRASRIIEIAEAAARNQRARS